jgi:hypothetical protein
MAKEEVMSSWAGEESTGLFDKGRVTITDESGFGFHPNYQGGNQPVFILRGETDDAEHETVELLYSIGTGWEVEDGGESVSGRATFRTNCNYWRLVLSAVENGLGDTLQARGESYEAKVWHGLTVDMKRVELDMPGLELREGQRKPNTVLIVGVPEAVGKGAGKKAAGAVAKKVAAVVEADEDADAAEDDETPETPAAAKSPLTPKQRIALTKLAKENDDHDDFMAAALEVDGVSGNEALEELIMASGKASFWATARGK